MMNYPDFTTANIIVIGDIMLDRYYWGKVARISPEAPVPVVKVTRKTRSMGGAGNVARNLAGLKCPLSLLAVCGNDTEGAYLSRTLTAEKIDHHLAVSAEHPTTTKTRVIGQGQQLLRLDEEETGAIAKAVETELLQQFESRIDSAGAVILSDYGKGIFNGDFAQKIITRCKSKNIPVFVDPKGGDWQRYSGAACITPNESEFSLIAPFDPGSDADLEVKAGEIIAALDLSHLLVTRGARGMSLLSPGRAAVHIPTKAREVYDVSGAGDTVIACLAAAKAAGLSMAAAAKLANTAAGVVVGKLGTWPINSLELKQALLGREIAGKDKIADREQSAQIADQWRKEGNRVVFTNGCFDILHIGHMKILKAAAEHGHKLIVGLNSDASVGRLKGDARPVVPEEERASLLSNMESVDLVVIFEEDTPLELIKEIKPDVLVKGGDYTPDTVVGRSEVESYGGRVVIVPLLAGKSTTNVIQQMNTSK